jgi:adenylate cyclase
MSVTFLAVCVHFIDRQADYMNRLDFCWKQQLLDEQEEANTTRTVNKMLLRNILPNHVGEKDWAKNNFYFNFPVPIFNSALFC